MTGATAGPAAPYPGLRSFLREETEVFFGRDGAVHDMLRRLDEQHFLAVLGASGSGKSSLVRTGMLEGLELGLIARAGSWWRVIDIRPGSDPLLALARALCPADAAPEEAEQMRAFLLGGPRSLVQLASSGLLQPGENLLLLVDQFEELFRYRDYDGHQEAEAFVALLLESARSREVPVYVTLTMRSEYLGACALFDGLAEAMNRGQYLTPRLGREQCRAAIEGPAAVWGFDLRPELVTALLNDLARFAPWSDGQEGDLRSQLDMIGRRADQLPLLQHVLNRMWLRAQDRQQGSDEPVVLTLEDYQSLGGLRGAIDQHARSIADSLSPAGRKMLEPVFRALTTGSNVAEAVRRPTRFATLVAVCGGDRAAVTEVVEAFRAPGRSFLTPGPAVPLMDDTVVDISHESLIRQWTDLSAWLEAEARDVESLRRLDEAANREAAGTGELLDGRDLAPLKAWREETELPNAWAARHVQDPARTFAFLDRSVAEAEARRRNTLRRRRLSFAMAVGLAGLGVAAVALMVLLTLNRSRLDQAETQMAALAEESRALTDQATAARAEAEVAKAEQEAAAMLREAALREAEAARRAMEEADAEADRARAAADAAARQQSAAQEAALKADAEAGELRRTLRDQRDLLSSLTLGQVEPGFLQIDPGAALDAFALVSLLPPDVADAFAPASVWATTLARAFGRQAPDPALTRLGIGGIGSLTRFSQGAYDPGVLSPYLLVRREDVGADLSYAVTDPATGDVLHDFTVEDGTGGELSGYALSMSGRSALLRDYDGRLLRWEAGQTHARRVLDRAWLTPLEQDFDSWRQIQRAVFDEATGDIAVVFTQYNLPHIVILPPTGAAEAQVWRMPDLSARVVKALGLSVPFDLPLLEPLALRGGELALMVTGEGPTGDSFTRIVGLRPATGEVRQITGDLGWALAAATTDPDRANLVLLAGAGDCTQMPPGNTFAQPDHAVCLGSVDLASGAVAVVPAPVPLLASLPIRMVLPPTPVDPALPQTAGGRFEDGGIDQTWPPLDLAPPSGPATRPWLDGWTTITSGTADWRWTLFSLYEVRRTRDSLTLWNADTNEPQGVTIGPDLVPRVIDGLPSIDLMALDLNMRTPLIPSEDGRSGLVLDSRGDVRSFAAAAGSATAALSDPLELSPSPSCTSRAPTGAGTEAEALQGTPAAAPAIAQLVQAATASADWSVVLLAEPQRLALVHRNGETGLDLHCPGGLIAETVLGSDLASGRLAVAGTDGRVVQVWYLPAHGRAEPQVAAVPLPDGHSIRAAAFPAGDDVLFLTSEGRVIVARPTSPSAASKDAPVVQGEDRAPMEAVLLPGTPLPGAALIQARGDRLLFLRDLTARATALAAPGNVFTLVGMADLAPDRTSVRLTHAAALPMAMSDVAAWWADATGPLLSVVARNGYLLRIGLPEAPQGRDLSDELLTLASPETLADIGSLDPALSSIGLLVSSLRDELAEPPLLRSVACAALVERQLRALERPDGSALEGPLPCDDDNALAQVQEISPPADTITVEPPFSSQVSALLARAAAGDGIALRAALARLAAVGTSADGAGTLAVRLLLDRLSADRPDPPVPQGAGDAKGGDALAHLRLARAAMDGADPALAFRHAWIAEQILALAGDTEAADRARSLRHAAGSRLSVAERRAVLDDLRTWRPEFLPIPEVSAPEAPLDADLTALDGIGRALGDPALARVLQFARLQQAIAPATGADRAALLARSADLIAADPLPALADPIHGALARDIAALRAQLDEAGDATRARRMDALFVSLIEASSDGLPLTDAARIADYLSAIERLVAAGPQAETQGATPLLRLNPVRPGFGIRDVPHTQGFALITARETLALAYPQAEGATVVAAASPFWKGIVLDARAAALRDAGEQAQSDAIYFDAAAAQVEGLKALMALMDAGGLTTPEERVVLAMAANWGASDLPAESFRTEAPRFDALDTILRENAQLAERIGDRPPAWLPVWNIALFDDVRMNKLVPFGTDTTLRPLSGEDAALLLPIFGHAADYIRQSRRGEINQRFDDDSFIPARWTAQIASAIGYVAGRAVPPGADASDCDLLASHPVDPARRSPGISFATLRVQATAAVDQCRAELLAERKSARKSPEREAALTFMLGRALDAQSEELPVGTSAREALQAAARTCYIDAARSGSVMALSNLQNIFDDGNRPLRRAYHEQAILVHFATAHAALSALPGLTEADRSALLELARHAADLGSVEAAMILGETEPDPADRAVWLLRAGRAMQDAPKAEGDSDRAFQALSEAQALMAELDPETAGWVKQRSAVWVKEGLVDIAASVSDLYPDPMKQVCE